MNVWVPDLESLPGPKYLAISSALAGDIRTGKLRPGDRLPPQRDLAKALGVDLTTVTRAYAVARRDGLIEANSRRGSFVKEAAPIAAPGKTNSLPAPVIDLGMNMPPVPRDLPLGEMLAEAMAQVLHGPDAAARLHYQARGGAIVDRAAGATWLSARIPHASEDRVLVAGGAQQALWSVCRLLLNPGDVLLTGAVIYPGMKWIAEQLKVKIVPIADEFGYLDLERLRQVCLQDKPKALYTVPTMDNPTTRTLSDTVRKKLADLAVRHRFWIIEDDAYGALPSAPLQPIAAHTPDRTWHIASLSKAVSPALRVAYVLAPSVVGALMLEGELHGGSVMAPPINAGIASTWILEGTLGKITAAVRAESARRQAVLIAALGEKNLQADPEGHHAWLSLPKGWTGRDFSDAARRVGVAAVAGETFAVGSDPVEAVRLSIGAFAREEDVAKGARLLAALLLGGSGAVESFI
ncbi:PLP-dependent aminotransferase family protein [Flaviflagellibacter deserti]|uniref:PLP-dependent aminotransferase family protein n=1 Tax=Flaviflagellibacter deserti TaxID=2267266 RepID=A0ABV9YYV3_9HYPH